MSHSPSWGDGHPVKNFPPSKEPEVFVAVFTNAHNLKQTIPVHIATRYFSKTGFNIIFLYIL
jgi:hypothetical protein